MLISLILLLAACLRIYQLNNLPIALFGDEVDVGYHSLSLFTTLRDYMGHFLPVYIQSLSEWRAPLLMYVTAPFVGLLGPSAFSVRLPVALLGVLNVYLLYLFTNLLFPKEKVGAISVGLLAGLILALTPWHIHYSRLAFEATLLLSLLLAATLFFLKGLKEKTLLNHCLAALFFGLTFYSYSTANLFTPLLLVSLFFIYLGDLKRIYFTGLSKTHLPLLLGIILVLPIAYQLLFGQAAGRFSLISIFSDSKTIDYVITQRTDPWVASPTLERLFRNKFSAYPAVFTRQYLESFSPQFLFISGDPYFRHSPGNFGQLLWAVLPFLILGFVKLLTSPKNRSHRLLLVWLLLAPIPAALTQSGGMHASRLFVMLVPLTILSAIGVYSTLEKIRGRNWLLIFGLVLAVLTTVNLAAYWYRYSAHYRFESAPFYDYGYEEIFAKLGDYSDSANKIYINNTNQPSLLRFAFYSKLPPTQFQSWFQGDVPVESLLPSFSGFAFGDKYFFGQVNDADKIAELLGEGDIYLAVQGKEVPGDWDWFKSPPSGLKGLEVIYNLRGQPLFYLMSK